MLETNLQKKIDQDLVAAMKRKDVFTVKVLRYAKSFVDAAAKEKKAPLSNEEVVRVLQRRIKQSQDAAEQFRQGKRDDLALSEQREIELITQYLPKQLSLSELEELVKGVIAGLGSVSPKDFGRVMSKTMAEVAGRADGKTVKNAVEKLLAPPR